jgi:hypothetical protein
MAQGKGLRAVAAVVPLSAGQPAPAGQIGSGLGDLVWEEDGRRGSCSRDSGRDPHSCS